MAGPVATDARAAYVDLEGAELRRVMVEQGTFLRVDGTDVLGQTDGRSERTDYENQMR